MIVRDWMKQNVVSISARATIREAAAVVVERHIGLLPVVDEQSKLIGVIGLKDLLSLELPDFINLLTDVDFVHDFGAVETNRPTPEQLDLPITALVQPVTCVDETCGLLRAYALMLKRNLHDLPIVNVTGELVGIASRVDLGTAILSSWKAVPSSKP